MTNIVNLVSAGGVVYRIKDETVQIILCGRESPINWSLPKGGQYLNETIKDTATREVEEETGLKVRIKGLIDIIEYTFMRANDQAFCRKAVHFYLMSDVGGNLSLHDNEFDVVQWFPGHQAPDIMRYPGEIAVVDKALHMIKLEFGTV